MDYLGVKVGAALVPIAMPISCINNNFPKEKILNVRTCVNSEIRNIVEIVWSVRKLLRGDEKTTTETHSIYYRDLDRDELSMELIQSQYSLTLL